MALLNRFSKLNDRGETGIFTFIVTKSVTRDFHRDATTKDFCFGYHRWAISFQRPNEKVLGVHLLLRNPSPSTFCLVDFTLTLLNREHFSQNEVYTKRQAKFTITNPMQGVARWIQMSDLIDRHFSNETGEFLFELSLSNMTTIFECDIQLSPTILNQYKSLLKLGLVQSSSSAVASQQPQLGGSNSNINSIETSRHSGARQQDCGAGASSASSGSRKNSELINLETNYFTFGAFDWSLTIVPLVMPSQQQQQQQVVPAQENSSNTSSSSSSNNNLLTPIKQLSSSSLSIASTSSQQQPLHSSKRSAQKKQQPQQQQQQQPTNQCQVEPVCRVYLNRLNGFDCLCRVKYRVILGHHQPGSPHPAEFVDSRLLDQISDSGGRIRGHQFRNTNILKLISLKSSTGGAAASQSAGQPLGFKQHQQQHSNQHQHQQQQQNHSSSSLDLRVHIEMFCANTVSEARVPMQRKSNEAQVGNCSDRNKQAWCVESDSENENVRLKLFFMDLQSVPRNHIRYISWIAYIVVRRDSKSGPTKESIAVRNSPHSNYYLQDGIDMGTLMDTDITTKELNNSPKAYLWDGNQLTVHIEWVDSLLLFSHLYNNYDSLATIQRHQIRRELSALQQEFELLERKYLQNRKTLNHLLESGGCQSVQPSAQLTLDHQTQENSGGPMMTTNTGPTNHHGRHTAARKGSTATSEQSAANWSHGALATLEGSAALAASAVALSQHTIMGHHQQQRQYQQQKTPMSHEERLKFSSSTPPGRTHHNQQQQQQQQGALPLLPMEPACCPPDTPSDQQMLEQLKLSARAGSLTGSQASRRRLPQQPVLGKIQAQEMRHISISPDLLAGYPRELDSPPACMFGSPVKMSSNANESLDSMLADAATCLQRNSITTAMGQVELATAQLSRRQALLMKLDNCGSIAQRQQACTTQLLTNQPEGGEQIDRQQQQQQHCLEGTSYPIRHHHRSSSNIPAQQAASVASGSPTPYSVYERVIVRPTSMASERVLVAGGAELGLDMEALYVSAQETQLEQAIVDELVVEARRESEDAAKHQQQQQQQGMEAALARHREAATFAAEPAALDHQFESRLHYERHYEHHYENRL